MSETLAKPITFEEFAAMNSEGRYELVDGQLEELVAPRPRHGWTYSEFVAEIVPYLRKHDPGHFRGGEVDVPTIPFHGRRPDFVYYASQDGGVDIDRDVVTRPPTLAVEILSEGDEDRDLVTKRSEYARAGIKHYWILDPIRKVATTLVLESGSYRLTGEFGVGDTLVSEFFPGLGIRVAPLFL
jgi:Uma2 family endonuclease